MPRRPSRPAQPSRLRRAKAPAPKVRGPAPAAGRIWVQVAVAPVPRRGGRAVGPPRPARVPRRDAHGVGPKGRSTACGSDPTGPRTRPPAPPRSCAGRKRSRALGRAGGQVSRVPVPRGAPEWIRERKLRLAELHERQEPDALARPAHRLRGGPLSQPRRVLRARDGDVPPARRRLHAGLRLLRHRERQARARSTRWSPGASRAAVERDGAAVRRPDLGRPRRPARRRRRALRRRRSRAVRSLEPAPGVEVLTPDFRGRFESLATVVDGAAGRLQPQRRDGAAAVRATCAAERGSSGRSACSRRRRTSTRRSRRSRASCSASASGEDEVARAARAAARGRASTS